MDLIVILTFYYMYIKYHFNNGKLNGNSYKKVKVFLYKEYQSFYVFIDLAFEIKLNK